jgi:hypothetical protein
VAVVEEKAEEPIWFLNVGTRAACFCGGWEIKDPDDAVHVDYEWRTLHIHSYVKLRHHGSTRKAPVIWKVCFNPTDMEFDSGCLQRTV